jgi:hypothetical protein
MSPSVSKSSALTLCLSFFGAVLLAGCSNSFEPADIAQEQTQTPIGNIQGTVHGGQSPVTGAQIYLYQASTAGYGTAATSLICNSSLMTSTQMSTCTSQSNVYENSSTSTYYVKTDGNGDFALSGDYVCTAGSAVYMVAVGGNPGLTPATTNNTAIVQMAALGECPSSGSMASLVPYLDIDEVTTVAFAYAVGGFATNAYNVSSDAGGATALVNAFANANNIVGLAWGGTLSAANGNSNSVAPQAKINALADILSTCVNTSSYSSSQCNSLFGDAKNSAGTQPTDEATAIFNIVHNPVANVSGLYGLYPSTPVFTPGLSAAPNDWALPVVYTGVTGTPSGMAIDENGNVWISDSTKNAVVELGPQGTKTSYTNGGAFGSMTGIAVNPVTADIWASDSTNNKVYILSPTGALMTTITTGSLNKPKGIAFDHLGNGYVVNSGAYVIGEYGTTGSLLQTLTYPSAVGYSTNIAVDYYGDVFVTGASGEAGLAAVQPGFTTGVSFASGGTGTYALALDATSNVPLTLGQYYTIENNVWTLGTAGTGTQWQMIVNSQTPSYTYGTTTNQTYLGWQGGMNPNTTPSSLMFDGGGNLWVANLTPAAPGNCCTSYGLTGITITGGPNSYTASGMSGTGFATGTATNIGVYLAVPDASGSVWTANADGSVSQVLGIATPQTTPTIPGKFTTKP